MCRNRGFHRFNQLLENTRDDELFAALDLPTILRLIQNLIIDNIFRDLFFNLQFIRRKSLLV